MTLLRSIFRTFPVAALKPGLLALALSMPLSHLAPAHAQLTLPSMGDGADMTSSEERRIGDRIIRSLYRDPDYIDDPQLHAYVLRIWEPLVQAARDRGDLSDELQERFAWEVLLGRDKSINAFALPGGYLGVHLGLIAAVTSSDELATVMAHELTHVTQRHIARMVGQEKKSTPLLIAGMILGALAASKSPDAASALIVGGQAAAIQKQLGFSRDMEREADRIGYSLLEPAGFAPQGAVSMFDKLEQASRLNDNGSWPYLRSHPLTTERMADMQARVPHGKNQSVQSSMEHAMMAARALVLTRPGIDKLRQLVEMPQHAAFSKLTPAQQAGQLYAAALSALQLRDLPTAQRLRQQLDTLAQQHPEPQALQEVRWLGMELALAQKKPAAALALATPSIATKARPELLLGGQALLETGQARQASDQLQTWLVDHPKDAAAWRLLAQAWHAQGFAVRAIRAEAEAQVANYDYAAAVDRFKAAQDAARRGTSPQEHIDASIVDTRLREVESLLREQTREQ